MQTKFKNLNEFGDTVNQKLNDLVKEVADPSVEQGLRVIKRIQESEKIASDDKQIMKQVAEQIVMCGLLEAAAQIMGMHLAAIQKYANHSDEAIQYIVASHAETLQNNSIYYFNKNKGAQEKTDAV